MKTIALLGIALFLLAGMLSLCGCDSGRGATVKPPPRPTAPAAGNPSQPAAPGTAAAGASDYRFSGPYTHANLSLFLVHGADTLTGKTYLTLQEALEQKKVVVHETGNVGQLAIENVSPNEEVYIQGGDIVKGGRQDRVLAADVVVPKNSGKQPVDSFCVEANRWSQRAGEDAAKFDSSKHQAAGKSLKLAAKHAASQGEVWKEVADNQQKLKTKLNTEVKSPQSASSYQLTLENKAVKETADDYVKALDPIVKNQRDAIGFAFAINGEIYGADVYGSHELFEKMWPKMLYGAAIEAIADLDKGKNFKPVTMDAVKAMFTEAENAKPTEKQVSGRVKMETRDTAKSVLFETYDAEQKNGKVHRNVIRK